MIDFLEKFGINSTYVLVLFGLGIGIYTFTLLDLQSNMVFSIMATTAPIWLPVVTFKLFYEAWLDYVRKDFDLAQGRVTLEIKLPQEIFKSPEAMELVLNQLFQKAGADNHIQTYWDGKHAPLYSLELVSRGGDVRFYMNVPKKKFKNLAETQLYAQYPGIEVHELDVDYTSEIVWNPDKYNCMAFHYGLTKADAYPIKTYVEYGLQNMPKEEEKIDPITTALETLGSIGPNEHMWIQILIDANKKATFKEGSLTESDDWKTDAKKEINKIIDGAVKRAGAETKGNIMQLLTETEKDTIKAIERSLGKNAFNTRIRGIYLATKDAFNGDNIGKMNASWASYTDLNRNSIGINWRTDFDWNWWQDPKGKRALAYKKQEIGEYKKRGYTSHSHGDKAKVMTVEELATIFHFPGKVATTPTLGRIPSKRAEPPSNLPIG